MPVLRRPRTTVRCVMRSAGVGWARRYGASGRVLAARGGSISASPTALAVANFAEVWTWKGLSESRYSDGSFNVLYTATTSKVAKAERMHWLIQNIIKAGRSSSRAIRSRPFLIYGCSIKGGYRNYTKRWKSKKEIVHPTNYGFCHAIASRARSEGATHILVPSARRLGGCCVPVFDRRAVRLSGAVATFDVSWDPKKRQVFIERDGRRYYIKIDEVYRMI